MTILIGSDVPEAHWIIDQRIGLRKQPRAARTLLGWTMIGPIGAVNSRKAHINFVITDQETLSRQLERMYNAEFNDLSQIQVKPCQ
jgi:hypothetical protein